MIPVETADVLTGLATHLYNVGLGRYSTSTYTEDPTKPGIFFIEMKDAPNTAVALTVYMWDRTRDSHNPDVYVQLRIRAAPGSNLAVDRLADRFAADLHWADDHPPEVWAFGSRKMHVLNSIQVVRTQPVKDSNNRWERFDSYRITFNPGE